MDAHGISIEQLDHVFYAPLQSLGLLVLWPIASEWYRANQSKSRTVVLALLFFLESLAKRSALAVMSYIAQNLFHSLNLGIHCMHVSSCRMKPRRSITNIVIWNSLHRIYAGKDFAFRSSLERSDQPSSSVSLVHLPFLSLSSALARA